MQPNCIPKHVPFCTAYRMKTKLLGTQFKGPWCCFQPVSAGFYPMTFCAPTKWTPSLFFKNFIYNQAYVLCAWCSLWLRWSIFPNYQNSSCGFSLGSARISRLMKPCFPIRSHSIVHFLFWSSTLDSDCCYTTCFTLSCYHELLCLYSPTRSQAPGSHADLRHEYISQIGRTWMYSNASPSFLIQCWLQGFHKTAGMMKSH